MSLWKLIKRLFKKKEENVDLLEEVFDCQDIHENPFFDIICDNTDVRINKTANVACRYKGRRAVVKGKNIDNEEICYLLKVADRKSLLFARRDDIEVI
jgi:hypothetical protein